MKANELRKTNTVMSKITGHPTAISGGILFNSDKRINELYEPIPLTEEWLIKFGFKKGISEECRDGNGDVLMEEYEYWYLHVQNWGRFIVNSESKTSFSGSNCEYIHKLQNVFFALTGEELIC